MFRSKIIEIITCLVPPSGSEPSSWPPSPGPSAPPGVSSCPPAAPGWLAPRQLPPAGRPAGSGPPRGGQPGKPISDRPGPPPGGRAGVSSARPRGPLAGPGGAPPEGRGQRRGWPPAPRLTATSSPSPPSCQGGQLQKLNNSEKITIVRARNQTKNEIPLLGVVVLCVRMRTFLHISPML
jgi:hypothetical protein